MSYLTVEVDIDHGRILPREPDKLPAKASGLLTILQHVDSSIPRAKQARQRVKLPLIQGDGQRIINPTPTELDASLWGD